METNTEKELHLPGRPAPSLPPTDCSRRYAVHGFCMVPMAASIEVDATSEKDAIIKARAEWNKDKRGMLISGSEDEGSACEWEPDAQPISENVIGLAAPTEGAPPTAG